MKKLMKRINKKTVTANLHDFEYSCACNCSYNRDMQCEHVDEYNQYNSPPKPYPTN